MYPTKAECTPELRTPKPQMLLVAFRVVVGHDFVQLKLCFILLS